MMNRSVQHGCIRDGTPDFDELKKLTEECSKGQVRGQEITKIREIHSRQDKRDPERTKRFESSRLNRQWWQRMNLDETYRAPSLFTWRY